MPWDETDEYIRSGHRDKGSFDQDSFRTINIDEAKGIKLVTGCPTGKFEGGKCSVGVEEQSFLFAKDKDWTRDKARQWFDEHKGRESFSWIGDVEIPEGKKLIRGAALHPIKTYHPNQWPKVREYFEKELTNGADSLKGTSLSVDHWRCLPFKVLGAKYEDGALEYVAEMDDEEILRKIRNKEIKHVSVEFDWGALVKQSDGAIAPVDIKFTGLTLLENIPPGDWQTTVEVWEGVTSGVKKYISEAGKLGEFLRPSAKRPAEETQVSQIQLDLEDHLEWTLLKERAIIFHGDVNEWSSQKALRRLEFLANESNAPIHIILNSVGGSVYNGLLIYDTIKKIAGQGIPVFCEARGLAASMGCILMQAGTKRLATPNTRFLIHEVSDVMWGKASEIEDQVIELEKVNNMLKGILAERTGKSPEEIQKIWHKNDVWLSAEEALRFGLIDAVTESISFDSKVREYEYLKESRGRPFSAPTYSILTMEEAFAILGEPFAGFPDFAACERANQDKKDPAAYCAAIKAQTEESKWKLQELRMFEDMADLRKSLKESQDSAELFKKEASGAKLDLQRFIGEVESSLPNDYILRLAGPTGVRCVEAIREVLYRFKEK